MSIPLRKNDDIILEITGLTSEGSGVGRFEGFAVFVPYTLPGETVSAHIIKVTSSYAVGKLNELILCSPDRTEPLCPTYLKCGGCSLQHMSYEAQLVFKQGVVRDALERIGGLSGIEVKPAIGMDDPSRYRNKGSFPFASVDGKTCWGLYAQRSHRLIEMDDCIIERECTVKAAKATAEWADRYSVSPYDEITGSGILRHVVTRECSEGTAVCVVTTGELPHEDELISIIRKGLPSVKSIVHNINSRNTNVICGDRNRLLWGSSAVVERLNGLDFEVSQESFLQVNPVQTKRLYSLAVDGLNLSGSETVADIFCGIGTITLMLAKKASNAIGIEYVKRAVEDARKNAVINGIENAEFHCGAAEEILPRLIDEGRRLDCVVLDPPRKGADSAVLNAIAASGAKRVSYISCNPATLARDVKILSEHGYNVESVQPVDMFPFTRHVETVVLLSKLKSTHHIEVEIELDKMDLTKAESKATYAEIKQYVLDKFGLKVSQLYIAQVKRKHGIIERINYNVGEGKNKVPQVTPEKEVAIEDALRHFKMIE